MECGRCGVALEAGESREHAGQNLCEDCYIEAVSPVQACDPWAVHLAKSDKGRSGVQLTPAQQKIFEEAAAKADEYFLGLQRDAVDKMEEAYKKAGAKVHEMTQAEYEQWVALAKDTAWKEYAGKSATAKDLLDALLAVK